MRSPARVGVVGCGVISRHYAENARAFDEFDIVACADLDQRRGEALALEHGYRALSVEELVADPAIDVVLNLTPPKAHVDVIQAALAAGKHVYTEKPLATTSPRRRPRSWPRRTGSGFASAVRPTSSSAAPTRRPAR